MCRKNPIQQTGSYIQDRMGKFRNIKRAVQLHQGDSDLPPDRWQNRDLVPLPPSKSPAIGYLSTTTTQA